MVVAGGWIEAFRRGAGEFVAELGEEVQSIDKVMEEIVTGQRLFDRDFILTDHDAAPGYNRIKAEMGLVNQSQQRQLILAKSEKLSELHMDMVIEGNIAEDVFWSKWRYYNAFKEGSSALCHRQKQKEIDIHDWE